MMHISLVYAEPVQQAWLRLEVPENCTVLEAIERSGILKRFPEIDLDVQTTGIFGKVAKPDTPLRDGDRLEIYRPITADPETVPRRDLDE